MWQKLGGGSATWEVFILDWNWRAATIINELDHYVVPGSMVTVVADFADGEAEIARLAEQ